MFPYLSNQQNVQNNLLLTQSHKNALCVYQSSDEFQNIPVVKPTIFFEGKTDEKIFFESLSIFRPDLLDKVILKSETSAGAKWVERQIIAWACSLNKNNESYVKAVGLLDGDFDGKSANEEINRVIKNDSAQSTTFKVFKLSQNYAKHLIPIKAKGIDIPVCLEEMFPVEYWKYALSNDWLVLRNKPESFLKEPKNWNGFDITLKDYLTQIGLTEDEKIYLNCTKDENKESFTKYILNLDTGKKREALKPFELLIGEISNYLFN